jgi:isopropylmalate/homocitrate/citramalate synthase
MTAYDFELGAKRLRHVLKCIREAQLLNVSGVSMFEDEMDNIIAYRLAASYGCTVRRVLDHVGVTTRHTVIWIISWGSQ